MKKTIDYVGFASQKGEIDVYLAPGKEVKLVLFYHGFKGFKDWGAWHLMVDQFTTRGLSIALMNGTHNGIGANPTEFTELDLFSRNSISAEQKDIKEAFFTLEEFLKTSNLILKEKHLIGHSKGGANAILFAKHNAGIKSVSSWAGVADWESLFNYAEKEQWKKNGVLHVSNARTGQDMPLSHEIWVDYNQNEEHWNIIKAASELPIPLLLVHGTEDEVIPMAQAKQIYDLCLHALLIPIENANHTFGSSHPWTEEVLPTHLDEVLESTIDFILDSDTEVMY